MFLEVIVMANPKVSIRKATLDRMYCRQQEVFITEREITLVMSSAELDRRALIDQHTRESCRAKPSARRPLCHTQAAIVLLSKVTSMILE
jgi:hypothetical protein